MRRAPLSSGEPTAAETAAALQLPPVVGHRGAASHAPENTLAGLAKAAALGASWVEFDVRLAGDGALVLLHDDRVDRTSGGRGDAASMTLAELKRLDFGGWFSAEHAGEPIPTLAEAAARLAALGLGANVEIKPAPGAERPTGRAVGAWLAEHWPASLPPPLVSSFKPESLAACSEAAPDLPRGLLLKKLGPAWRAEAEALGCRTIHADHRHLDELRVREVRDAGYPLLVYTVNDASRARLLFQWGVDSVISDSPERIVAAAPRKRLVRLPAASSLDNPGSGAETKEWD